MEVQGKSDIHSKASNFIATVQTKGLPRASIGGYFLEEHPTQFPKLKRVRWYLTGILTSVPNRLCANLRGYLDFPVGVVVTTTYAFQFPDDAERC